MRIALVSTCAVCTPPKSYGGTELVVGELAKGLRMLGHDVTVFATGDSEPAGQLRAHFEKPVWPPSDLAELRHAAFAWREITTHAAAFDVVHVHHATAVPFHLQAQHPTLCTLHHKRVEELVDHYRAFGDVAYVSISQRQAELHPEIPFVGTVHHGLDPALYPLGAGDVGTVAFLGRFDPEKAPHLAIDAAQRAGVRLRMGGRPHENAQAYFDEQVAPRLKEHSSRVDWCGELAHGAKVDLLQRAGALLFPIEWEEPFGLVMIEAMLVGTPVIAFKRGSAPEVVEDGVTGFLVNDVDEMAARIRQLATFDRAKCRARAEARWSSLRMAREYAALYAQLMLEDLKKLDDDGVVPIAEAVRSERRAVAEAAMSDGGGG